MGKKTEGKKTEWGETMVSENTRFELTILGSGTSVPSLERSSCSILLDLGDDKLLFDLGPGTMRRLLETR